MEEAAEEDVCHADQVVILAGLVKWVGIGPSDLHRVRFESPRLELFVKLPHVDQLQVELLGRPNLTRLIPTLDQNGRLADESSALKIVAIIEKARSDLRKTQ